MMTMVNPFRHRRASQRNQNRILPIKLTTGISIFFIDIFGFPACRHLEIIGRDHWDKSIINNYETIWAPVELFFHSLLQSLYENRFWLLVDFFGVLLCNWCCSFCIWWFSIYFISMVVICFSDIHYCNEFEWRSETTFWIWRWEQRRDVRRRGILFKKIFLFCLYAKEDNIVAIW